MRRGWLVIDHAELCRSAKADNTPSLITYLRTHLPMKWQQVYTAATSHSSNIVRVDRGAFVYFCDSYSGLEALGEIAFDQRVRDRAHSIGGDLNVNVFSQDRNLNRGISEQGKIYRQMEKYCLENLGTFCFSRPVYADSTSIPRWLEVGLIKEDGNLGHRCSRTD